MRRVMLGASEIETSCLGFGCASLGSRVGAREGLTALADAFDKGVRWFDFAPLYGGGRAEEIGGEFLRNRVRSEVQISTKVGLLPSGGGGFGLKEAILPIARSAVRAAPALRKAFKSANVQPARALDLTPELLHESLERSLRRFGTDYVDLYALHDAKPGDVLREDTLRALEDIVVSGKARAVAVASSEDTAAAAIAQGRPYTAVQFPTPAPGLSLDGVAAAQSAGFGLITHSVFGVGGALERMKQHMAEKPGFRALVTARARGGDVHEALTQLLLERALTLNSGGVVLLSMFSEASRRQNLALADFEPSAQGSGQRLALDMAVAA